MAKTQNRNFEIQAKLSLLATKTISAQSLEDALEEAKSLTETDFVTFLGDFVDGKLCITGVYESEGDL